MIAVMTYRNVRPTVKESFAYGIAATNEQVSRIVWSSLGARLVR